MADLGRAPPGSRALCRGLHVGGGARRARHRGRGCGARGPSQAHERGHPDGVHRHGRGGGATRGRGQDGARAGRPGHRHRHRHRRGHRVPPTSPCCRATSPAWPPPSACPGARSAPSWQNPGWAFGYNVAALPLAVAGALNPIIAGAAMAELRAVEAPMRVSMVGVSPRPAPPGRHASRRPPPDLRSVCVACSPGPVSSEPRGSSTRSVPPGPTDETTGVGFLRTLLRRYTRRPLSGACTTANRYHWQASAWSGLSQWPFGGAD